MSCVTFYDKDGCPLCDEARAELEELGHPFETARNPAYAERVPVIEVGGTVVTEGRISIRAVRRAIRAQGR